MPLNQPTADKEEVADSKKENPGQLYLSRTIKDIVTVEAVGKQTAEGFVVYVESHTAAVDDNTIPDTIKERRVKTTLDKEGKLIEEILFTSPSYAAMFVTGKSESGLTRWRDKDGKTLKSLEP